MTRRLIVVHGKWWDWSRTHDGRTDVRTCGTVGRSGTGDTVGRGRTVTLGHLVRRTVFLKNTTEPDTVSRIYGGIVVPGNEEILRPSVRMTQKRIRETGRTYGKGLGSSR